MMSAPVSARAIGGCLLLWGRAALELRPPVQIDDHDIVRLAGHPNRAKECAGPVSAGGSDARRRRPGRPVAARAFAHKPVSGREREVGASDRDPVRRERLPPVPADANHGGRSDGRPASSPRSATSRSAGIAQISEWTPALTSTHHAAAAWLAATRSMPDPPVSCQATIRSVLA